MDQGKHAPAQKRTCFFIGPIGDVESRPRKKSDQVLRHLVRRVLDPLDFETTRADELDEAGLITNQIIERLLEADLVVADLSGRNPNVFYELAVRHATRKPVVHLIERGEDLPFDVANTRTISYAVDDPDALEGAREELSRKVRATLEAGDGGTNPISAASDLAVLRHSGEPQKEVMGDVLAAVSALRSDVHALGQRLNAGASPRSGTNKRGEEAQRGARVVHSSFGEGEVKAIEDGGVVWVQFDDGTDRALMWDYAPIRYLPLG